MKQLNGNDLLVPFDLTYHLLPKMADTNEIEKYCKKGKRNKQNRDINCHEHNTFFYTTKQRHNIVLRLSYFLVFPLQTEGFLS